MRAKILFLSAIVVFMVFSAAAFADVSSAIKETGEQTQNIISTVGDVLTPKTVSGYGEAFANTIKETCSALNVSINDFIKSPVGVITLGVIAIKFIGPDVAMGIVERVYNFVIGIPILLIGWLLIACMARHFFMRRQIWEYKAGKKDTKKESVYEFNSDGTREIVGIVFCVFSIIFTFIMLFIIF